VQSSKTACTPQLELAQCRRVRCSLELRAHSSKTSSFGGTLAQPFEVALFFALFESMHLLNCHLQARGGPSFIVMLRSNIRACVVHAVGKKMQQLEMK
jgi:hypothetical protein